ncbi:hypothetical protein EGW08_018239 [Elysia chlorotica]|uniref:Uncharacterized protein n=1 Tax=Elysia chlorotica TaxID=188477 RepID=A0A3S0Z9V5_ELYCH|nr:hypothetical protein EGW08_018239 [Elysia chlorotica]
MHYLTAIRFLSLQIQKESSSETMEHKKSLLCLALGIFVIHVAFAQSPTDFTGQVDTVDPALTDVSSPVTSGSGSAGQPDAIAPDSIFIGSPTNLDQVATAPPPVEEESTTAAPTTASLLAETTASGGSVDPGPPQSPDAVVGGGGAGAPLTGEQVTTSATVPAQQHVVTTTAAPVVVVTQAPPPQPPAPTSGGAGQSSYEAEVRETVYALLNETGHLVNANEQNVQELVNLLMNETSITDADLIRLGFIPSPQPPPVPVDPTPPPYVIPTLPGVDLSGGVPTGGSTNPVPSTGTGTTSTQTGSGSVLPPSITDIFGLPSSGIVDTSGGAGSAGAVISPGAGSTPTGTGILSPADVDGVDVDDVDVDGGVNGVQPGGTDPLGGLLGGMTVPLGSIPTSGSSATPNAITDPASIIPPGAFASGPMTMPGLGTSGSAPTGLPTPTNPLLPGILDTAYNTQPKNGGLFSNPLMMMFMFPEMGEMMGGENSMMTFFLMNQFMNRGRNQQAGGANLMGPGGAAATSPGMSLPSGLPSMGGAGSSPASTGASPNFMDMLNSMGPPPATSGLPALPGTGSPTSTGGAPNFMDMLNSMGPSTPTSGAAMAPSPQLDFASFLNQPSTGTGSTAPAIPSMTDFMNMMNAGSQNSIQQEQPQK